MIEECKAYTIGVLHKLIKIQNSKTLLVTQFYVSFPPPPKSKLIKYLNNPEKILDNRNLFKITMKQLY